LGALSPIKAAVKFGPTNGCPRISVFFNNSSLDPVVTTLILQTANYNSCHS